MNALDPEQRQRYKEVIGNLNENRQAVKELADGYAFRYKAEAKLIQEAAEFIVYERLCCPFFDFELAVERETDRFWLRLKGEQGVKEFIRYEFNLTD